MGSKKAVCPPSGGYKSNKSPKWAWLKFLNKSLLHYFHFGSLLIGSKISRGNTFLQINRIWNNMIERTFEYQPQREVEWSFSPFDVSNLSLRGLTIIFHGNLEKVRRAGFTSAWISRRQPLITTRLCLELYLRLQSYVVDRFSTSPWVTGQLY